MVLQPLKRKETPERTQQASGAGRALGVRCSMSGLNFRGRLARGDLRRAAWALAWLTHVWEGWRWQSACPAAVGKGATK